jgi:predicted nucleotidyltransferase
LSAEAAGGHVEVYVFGSAVEGRLTTDCDIGVVAAMRSPPVGARLIARVLEAAWRGRGGAA